ncbi:uncharacterized protein EDB91DRAFT_1247527 [Suillus paluster]|uniref:uncharacterized protein n=1 Tax=Suillus paluster TaxID=48578 RepID=UPI001B875153|nr:uncharacterized protein EDB91DRAFT_1247527 [Suillus paluster]KAG1742720.1 hypothetical protein EDB91DRAFT_1247527 [Suillus paluster]
MALVIAKIMSNNNTTDTETNGPSNSKLDSSLEADIAHLSNLVINGSLDGSNETEDLIEILARLESADGMAQGIEGRLDDILGTLDDLLTSLEADDEAKIMENEKTISVEAERVAVASAESNPSGPALSP